LCRLRTRPRSAVGRLAAAPAVRTFLVDETDGTSTQGSRCDAQTSLRLPNLSRDEISSGTPMIFALPRPSDRLVFAPHTSADALQRHRCSRAVGETSRSLQATETSRDAFTVSSLDPPFG